MKRSHTVRKHGPGEREGSPRPPAGNMDQFPRALVGAQNLVGMDGMVEGHVGDLEELDNEVVRVIRSVVHQQSEFHACSMLFLTSNLVAKMKGPPTSRSVADPRRLVLQSMCSSVDICRRKRPRSRRLNEFCDET